MNNKSLAITMIANAFAFIINSCIGLLLTPFIVRNVGAESYGFVSLANNFTGYIQILTVALNSMAGRFITIAYVQKKYDEANRYFTSTLYANSFIAIVLLLISSVFVIRLDKFINISNNILTDTKILFALVFSAFILSLFGVVFSIATFSKNRKDIEAKRSIESYFVKAIVIILLFSIFKPHIYFVGVASVAITIYKIVFDVYYTKKLTPEMKIRKKYFDFGKIITLVKSGIWNSISRLGGVLSDGLDLLVANLFLGPQVMGLLSVAKTLPNIISPFVGTIGSIFVPSYTIAYAKNQREQLFFEMERSIKILSIVSNVCLATLAVVGSQFFSLWVPNLDSAKIQILSLITIMGLTVNGAIQCVWNVFTITNKIKLNSIVATSISFLNILIVFILLKTTNLGVYAIAGVSSVTNILKSLFFSIPYAAKCINIKKRFFYIPVIKAVFSLTLSTIICYFICSLKPINSWVSLILFAIPVVIVTGLITICIVLKPSDIKNIITKFKKGVCKK